MNFPSYNMMNPNSYPMIQPQMYGNSGGNAFNSSNRIWVQGVQGAKMYLVAPNSSVYLWDSESQRIYVKSADASGKPSIKVIKYIIMEDAEPKQAENATNEPQTKYVTLEQFEGLKEELRALQGKMKNTNNNKGKKFNNSLVNDRRQN